MTEHKETCLKINGKQSVKLRSGSIKFKNYFKHLTVLFKTYADFESILKGVKNDDKNNNASSTKNYQSHIPRSFTYKGVCIDDKFSKPVVLYRGKNAVNKFIGETHKEYDYCKNVTKKHFNKNLVMSAEDDKRFQSINKCWICNKLFGAADNKGRDHCHITGKYRGSAHWSCNINLKLAKNAPVMFHNLRDYDNNLIMQEIGKFGVKISVLPNGLEKCMAFTINKNSNFLDSMQFMNSNLDTLVKNLSKMNFKHLSQDFSGEQSELVKQKGVYLYEYIDSFNKFFDEKLLDRCEFFNSLKDKCINEKDYLCAIDVWIMLKLKTRVITMTFI